MELKQNYQIDCLLGRGASGSVYGCTRNSDGVKVAVKEIPRDRVPDSRIAIDTSQHDGKKCRAVPMEVYILRRLQNQHIIKLLDFFEDREKFYVVTEIHGSQQWQKRASKSDLQSRDLFEFIEKSGTVSEVDAIYILKQVVSAVIYLKSMNVYHLDLKDENIVIDQNLNVKLIDFGSSHIICDKNQKLNRFFGTLDYAAPEVLLGQPYEPELTEIWALGTLLWTMLYGCSPYGGAENVVKNQTSPYKQRSDISIDLIQLVEAMLERDHGKQITLQETQTRMNKM